MDQKRRERVLQKLSSADRAYVKQAAPSAASAELLKKALLKSRLLRALKGRLMGSELTGTALQKWPKYHNLLIRAMM